VNLRIDHLHWKRQRQLRKAPRRFSINTRMHPVGGPFDTHRDTSAGGVYFTENNEAVATRANHLIDAPTSKRAAATE
jgi:hypothetical protein